MGLIELIGESIRPGEIGTIDTAKGKKEKRVGKLIVKRACEKNSVNKNFNYSFLW